MCEVPSGKEAAQQNQRYDETKEFEKRRELFQLKENFKHSLMVVVEFKSP